MRNTILQFASQFDFKPVVAHSEALSPATRFVVLGMGGSHLAADILKNISPDLSIKVHMDYDLPFINEEEAAQTLFIASSYSGNTEEVLSGAEEVLKKGYRLAIISTGGKLIEFAKANSIPHIILPNVGIQPRSALGFSIVTLTHVMYQQDLVVELAKLSKILKPESLEKQGEILAKQLQGYIPLIYTSERNRALAYNWKIKFNETGKVPSFYNIFPELNHNEMNGFDTSDSTKKLTESFYVIFLTDKEDHPRVQKRMKITREMYEERGIQTVEVPVAGDRLAAIFNSLLVADWASYYTATLYGVEPQEVPMIESFKIKIS